MQRKRIAIIALFIMTVACLTICVFAENEISITLDPITKSSRSTSGRNTSDPSSRASASAVSVERNTLSKNIATEKDSKQKVGSHGSVVADFAHIYKTSNKKSDTRGFVQFGTTLIIQQEKGSFYGILLEDGTTGWVEKQYIQKTAMEVYAKREKVPTGIIGYNPEIIPFSEFITHSYAFSKTPYVFGGISISSGMDCSAFVREIFSRMGVRLPRTAREQALVGVTVEKDPNQLIIGDRLYFRYKNSYVDHTGIYIGNGYYIHCNASKNGVSCDKLWDPLPSSKLVAIKRF